MNMRDFSPNSHTNTRTESVPESACCESCAAHEQARAGAFKPVAAGEPADKPKGLPPELKREIATLAAAAGIALAGFFAQAAANGPGAAAWLPVAATVVFAAAYLLAGHDVLLAAAKNLIHGSVFDELLLMAIASLGAFAIGAMEEAIGVMIFYKVGELLQEGAADRSRRSIRALLALRPDKARVRRGELWVDCGAEEVEPGDLVLVRPGERIPVDGTVVEGSGAFDTASMTGESAPRQALAGAEALSGFVALEGALTIRAERAAAESSAARIIDLVENASKSKAKTELFITRFARWYTPAVVIMALLVALMPALFMPGQAFSVWVYRALVILVISCPCALVLSVPLGYLGGLGGAARRGILIKGASILDALADAKTVVFDKTGTLTDASFSVRELVPEAGFDDEELLGGAVAAGTHSNHPLAAAIRQAWESTGKPHPASDRGSYAELPGHGTVASIGGREVLAGSDSLLHLKGIPHDCKPAQGTEIHVAIAGRYAGRIGVGDSLKADSKAAIGRLRGLGIRRLVMMTGDSASAAKQTAGEVGINEVHLGLLPAGKLERFEEILGQERGRGTVIFVGDGVNDAPVLARADAGIAMGGGSDAAVESSDVVLMGGEMSRVAEAIDRARRTRRIVIQNIVFALGVKVIVIGLGALGLVAMWEAVIADVGVSLLAVINSTRALR